MSRRKVQGARGNHSRPYMARSPGSCWYPSLGLYIVRGAGPPPTPPVSTVTVGAGDTVSLSGAGLALSAVL